MRQRLYFQREHLSEVRLLLLLDTLQSMMNSRRSSSSAKEPGVKLNESFKTQLMLDQWDRFYGYT